jgi:hypothetical protein
MLEAYYVFGEYSTVCGFEYKTCYHTSNHLECGGVLLDPGYKISHTTIFTKHFQHHNEFLACFFKEL